MCPDDKKEEEELQNVTILVFANKQDLKDALTADQVSEGLGLPSIKNRAWHIQVSYLNPSLLQSVYCH